MIAQQELMEINLYNILHLMVIYMEIYFNSLIIIIHFHLFQLIFNLNINIYVAVHYSVVPVVETVVFGNIMFGQVTVLICQLEMWVLHIQYNSYNILNQRLLN